MGWKKAGFGILLLFGVGGLFALFQVIDFQTTIGVIGDVGWVCVILFTLNFAMTLFLPGLGWWILLRAEGVRATYADVMRANLMGFSLNLILPSMYIGGEPLKLLYLSNRLQQPKGRILATIIVNKFQELTGLLLMMIIAAAIALLRVELSLTNKIIVLSSIVVLGGFFGLLFYAFLHDKKPTVWIINAVATFGFARRKLARLRTRAAEMETLIHIAFTHRWKTYLWTQFITLFSAISIFLRPFFFFFFLTPRITPDGGTLAGIYIVTNLLNTFSFTPGGLGTYEAGLAGCFSLLGIANGEHLGAAFALITRIADFLVVAVGLWLVVHYGYTQVARGLAQGKEKVTEEEIQQAIRAEEQQWPDPKGK